MRREERTASRATEAVGVLKAPHVNTAKAGRVAELSGGAYLLVRLASFLFSTAPFPPLSASVKMSETKVQRDWLKVAGKEQDRRWRQARIPSCCASRESDSVAGVGVLEGVWFRVVRRSDTLAGRLEK